MQFLPAGQTLPPPAKVPLRRRNKYDIDYSRFAQVESDSDASDTERQSLAPSLAKKVRAPLPKPKGDPGDVLRELESQLSGVTGSEAISAARKARRELEGLELEFKETKKRQANAKRDAARARQEVIKAEGQVAHHAADLEKAFDEERREENDEDLRPVLLDDKEERLDSEKRVASETKTRPVLIDATVEKRKKDSTLMISFANVQVGESLTMSSIGASSSSVTAKAKALNVDDGDSAAVVVEIPFDGVFKEDSCRYQVCRENENNFAKEGILLDPKGKASVVVDAIRHSRRARVQVEHLPRIKCFHVSLRFLSAEDGWTAIDGISLKKKSVEIACAFGLLLSLSFPVFSWDKDRCSRVDASSLRLGYSRLVVANDLPEEAYCKTVSIGYPEVAQTIDTAFETTSNLSDLRCRFCGSGVFKEGRVFARPRRPPSDEAVSLAKLNTESNDDLHSLEPLPGEPVECPRTIRLEADDLNIVTSQDERPLFPPRFLVVAASDRKAKPARCRRCDADLGLAFFENNTPKTVALYKHRLRASSSPQKKTEDNSSAPIVTFVAGLIVDEAQRGQTNLLLTSPAPDDALSIRVMTLDCHAATGDLDLETQQQQQQQQNTKNPLLEEDKEQTLPLLPTLKLSFHDTNLQPDQDTIALHPSDLAAFRDELHSKAKGDDTLLGPGWRLVSLPLLPVNRTQNNNK